jgi:hypothetical protein
MDTTGRENDGGGNATRENVAAAAPPASPRTDPAGKRVWRVRINMSTWGTPEHVTTAFHDRNRAAFARCADAQPACTKYRYVLRCMVTSTGVSRDCHGGPVAPHFVDHECFKLSSCLADEAVARRLPTFDAEADQSLATTIWFE